MSLHYLHAYRLKLEPCESQVYLSLLLVTVHKVFDGMSCQPATTSTDCLGETSVGGQ